MRSHQHGAERERLEGRLEAFESVHDQEMDSIRDDLYGLENDLAGFCSGILDSIKRRAMGG